MPGIAAPSSFQREPPPASNVHRTVEFARGIFGFPGPVVMPIGAVNSRCELRDCTGKPPEALGVRVPVRDAVGIGRSRAVSGGIGLDPAGNRDVDGAGGRGATRRPVFMEPEAARGDPECGRGGPAGSIAREPESIGDVLHRSRPSDHAGNRSRDRRGTDRLPSALPDEVVDGRGVGAADFGIDMAELPSRSSRRTGIALADEAKVDDARHPTGCGMSGDAGPARRGRSRGGDSADELREGIEAEPVVRIHLLLLRLDGASHLG